MFDKLFESIITKESSPSSYFFICLGVALVLGIAVSLAFMYKNRHTKSFVITLAVIPAIVELLIMMVNGNIGTGIAVAGAFSLVRFRSAQGSAREIVFVFLDTSLGIAIGTGFIWVAVIFCIVILAFTLLLTTLGYGEAKTCERELRITIPESLDYTTVFDKVFEKYTSKNELWKVRTTNMGSLYKLSYRISLKDAAQEKEFIDDLRVLNGNLDILCSRDISDSEDNL